MKITELLTKAIGFPKRELPQAETRSLFDLGLPISLGNGSSVSITHPGAAMNYSVVFACVDVISSIMSIIPLSIYEKRADGRHPVPDHDQSYLLRKEPHSIYSSTHFFKTLTSHYLLWGDGFARILRDKNDRPRGYLILDPWAVTPEKLEIDGELNIWYRYDGEYISSKDMIHVSDLSTDGVNGLSRIKKGASAITQGVSMSDYGADVFENGAKLNGYIYNDDKTLKLTPEAQESLVNKFLGRYGSKNSIGVLPSGWKYKEFQYPMPLGDAKLLEAKRFNKEEIYTLFRVPSFLVGDYSHLNNSISQELFRAFLMTTMNPIVRLYEQEFDRKIFRLRERNTHYVKFNLFALDRADMEKTMSALNTALQAGIMNKDEARSKLDMNPIPGGFGKTFYQALNQIPIDQAEDYFTEEKETA